MTMAEPITDDTIFEDPPSFMRMLADDNGDGIVTFAEIRSFFGHMGKFLFFMCILLIFSNTLKYGKFNTIILDKKHHR